MLGGIKIAHDFPGPQLRMIHFKSPPKNEMVASSRVPNITLTSNGVILGGFILSLVSIPQGYLRRTSDVNGSNISVSRLLCSLGNACSSKPPKYTFESRSTRLTSLLTHYQSKFRTLNVNHFRVWRKF